MKISWVHFSAEEFKYASNVIKIENKTQSIIIKNYEKAKHTDVNVCSQKMKYLHKSRELV